MRGLVVAGVIGALSAAACSSDAPPDEVEPACLAAPANLDCTPAYGLQNDGVTIAPSFQEVFDSTLPVCAASGCHSGAHPQHDLSLDRIDAAYQGLLATNAQGERRVIPGDVKCGKVIVRLESIGKPWSMPPGAVGHLKETDLCSIRHWIANGAPR